MVKYYPQPIKREFIPHKYSQIELFEGKPFTGIKEEIDNEECYRKRSYVNGVKHGVSLLISKEIFSIYLYLYDKMRLGFFNSFTQNKETQLYYYYDNIVIDNISEEGDQETLDFNREDLDYQKLVDNNPDVIEDYKSFDGNIDLDTFIDVYYENPYNLTREKNQQRAGKVLYAHLILEDMKDGRFSEEEDLMPYYVLQNELKEKVIKENQLAETIKYIAGVDVAYHDISQKMVGAIVVLDATTLEVVDQAYHEMEITFPYIPGLFSFREVPPILEALKKIKILPDLIVCDAQGIAHPKYVGMATHLGIELDIPTIGCAKKRLVGFYDKSLLGNKRGDTQGLIFNDEIVGKALRTQDNTNPMFVSIGHKIDLETAIDWVLKITPDYRLPETTRQSDHLVNQLLKERTELDYMGDCE